MAPVYSTLLVCSLSILSVFAQDAAFTDDKKFQDAILSTANRFRSEHGAPDLTWNDTLATKAENWAKQCRWRYSETPSGETLAAAHDSVVASVESWGNERKRYNFDRPGFSFDTNHFTQLVWKDSTSIGCARYDCGSIRPGDDDWDDMRWDNPDYDRDDEFEREDDRNDDRWDDDRWDNDHDRDDWDDDRDDDWDDRDDDDDDDWDDRHHDKMKSRRVVKRDDDDRARGWYVVCNYSPPGNIIGGTEFKDNVLPKGSSGGENGGSSGNNKESGDRTSTGGSEGGSGGRESSSGTGSDDSTAVPDDDGNAGVANGVSMVGLLAAVGVAVLMM